MSTALVSHVFDYDFTDAIYKVSNAIPLQSHKALSLDRKSLSFATAPRRNSTSGAAVASPPPTPLPKAIMGKPMSNGVTSLQTPAAILGALGNHHQQQPHPILAQQQPPPQREHRRLDRSLSEPVDRASNSSPTNLNGQQLRSAQANSSRYKTELCRPFEENGTCKYGDKCQFAHGGHELRTLSRHPKYKTELCRTFHTTGFCPYGPRCHFIHNSEESKKTLMHSLQSNMTIGPPGPQQQQQGPPPRQNHHHHHQQRPKALSLGSFSLGSAGELTPPSSVSDSPTSLNGFFVDDPFVGFSPTPTPANTAFSFSQDFASSFVGSKPNSAIFGENANLASAFNTLNGICKASVDAIAPATVVPPNTPFRSNNQKQMFTFSNISLDAQHKSSAILRQPSSPVDILGVDLDCMSSGSSSPPTPIASPCSNTASSAIPPRLPIFSRLSSGDSD